MGRNGKGLREGTWGGMDRGKGEGDITLSELETYFLKKTVNEGKGRSRAAHGRWERGRRGEMRIN